MLRSIDLFKHALQANGFKTSGERAYLESPFCTVGVEFQKSRFDDGYFVNFGLFFPQYLSVKAKAPKSYDWHSNNRLLVLGVANYIEHPEPIPTLLNQELSSRLQQFIEEVFVPHLKCLAEVDCLLAKVHSWLTEMKITPQGVTEKEFLSILGGHR